jgi:hypothetical protein
MNGAASSSLIYLRGFSNGASARPAPGRVQGSSSGASAHVEEPDITNNAVVAIEVGVTRPTFFDDLDEAHAPIVS